MPGRSLSFGGSRGGGLSAVPCWRGHSSISAGLPPPDWPTRPRSMCLVRSRPYARPAFAGADRMAPAPNGEPSPNDNRRRVSSSPGTPGRGDTRWPDMRDPGTPVGRRFIGRHSHAVPAWSARARFGRRTEAAVGQDCRVRASLVPHPGGDRRHIRDGYRRVPEPYRLQAFEPHSDA